MLFRVPEEVKLGALRAAKITKVYRPLLTEKVLKPSPLGRVAKVRSCTNVPLSGEVLSEHCEPEKSQYFIDRPNTLKISIEAGLCRSIYAYV